MTRIDQTLAGGRNVTAKIYSLSDPRTGEVRYVGKTIQPLRERLQAHLGYARSGGKRPVCKWLRGLLAVGLEPIPQVLEFVPDGIPWEIREQFWIARFRESVSLTNISVGGPGGAGVRHSDEWRKRMGDIHRGKKLSVATRNLLSAAHKGKQISAATKEKISVALKGREFSAETCRKISAAKRGIPVPNLACEHNPRAVLDWSGVMQIRAGSIREHEAKMLYGISRTQFYRVKRGEQWKEPEHV